MKDKNLYPDIRKPRLLDYFESCEDYGKVVTNNPGDTRLKEYIQKIREYQQTCKSTYPKVWEHEEKAISKIVKKLEKNQKI